MARPLRVVVAGGWYHVAARGTERRTIFGDEREHAHFVELLAAMVERYGVRLHAYVLMGNHYHLLVQAPRGNLSRAMQWLNVSYGVWFNRRRGRVGPLFQGRFKAVPIEGEGSWALDASVYLHLNPARVRALGLGKAERAAERRGLLPPPTPKMRRARLAALRGHRWSSYPAYAGYARVPSWLTCAELWGRARGVTGDGRRAYRVQVEEVIRQGGEEALAERIKGTLAVGSQAFLERLRRGVRGNRRTQPAIRAWQRQMPFARVIEAVASEKQEEWTAFRDRYGDDGRDLALWLGRRHGGMTLGELGAAAGGVSAAAVSEAIRRLDRRLRQEAGLQRMLARLEKRLLNIET